MLSHYIRVTNLYKITNSAKAANRYHYPIVKHRVINNWSVLKVKKSSCLVHNC